MGLVVLAIGCYAMSLAPVVWVIISEIFPNRIRGTAMSLAVTALWLACFILTVTFRLSTRGSAWRRPSGCTAASASLGFVYLILRLPETKGKTLEELEHELTMT